MSDLVTMASIGVRTRIAVALLLAATLILALYGVRWQLGDMLASLTPPSAADAADVAGLALELAPSDPMASWLRAASDADPQPNIELYENAVRLSPSDYRWHVELGRAYEDADRLADAEKELRTAAALAPTYAYPSWQLGNFLLRHRGADEAFNELKKAASNDHAYRDQVFSLAWDYFGRDPARVESLCPDTPYARAGLALFFAARGRADDALRVWNRLSADEKAANSQFSQLMAKGLYAQRSFPQALEFFRQMGVQTDARTGAITNAGFEQAIGRPESPFGWQVFRSEPKLDIGTDSTTKHSGSRGLRLAFRNYAKPELYNVVQVAAVEPNKGYRLTFWVRTEDLRSGSLPLLQVMNANDDKLLAVSKPFPDGSTGWQQFTLEFRTPENCNGVRLQTSRAPCEQCPVVGTLWYDDFEMAAL
jgi:hypothetical protein